MKNPLRKRWLRDLKNELGKYIALFLFLFLTIAFVSGFLVADNSMKVIYVNSFSDYDIENGHFTTDRALTDEELASLAKNLDLSIYPLTYIDRVMENEHTVRFYQPRDPVNRVDLLSGSLPAAADEIVIDRLYAENNDLSIGDTLTVSDLTFRITGFVALSDYSTLYKSNNDMLFDANKFTVSIVTRSAFDSLGTVGLHHCYAWLNDDDTLSDSGQLRLSERLMYRIYQLDALEEFIPRQQNQAINFAGDDMGSDYVMMQTLLYIIMVILAFIFAITARSTIEQESGTVGTLLASGYTRRELLTHYLTLPMLVTLLAAICGNIVGYGLFKSVPVMMYRHSYSLTHYETLWNGKAFWQTTVIPLILIFVVNVVVLWTTLKLPPLQFLRHELRFHKKAKVIKLKAGSFLSRFRTRVILQNTSAYLTLSLCILFASVLLMFGMMFSPLLTHFKEDVVSTQIADYQYILKSPQETAVSGAEKYSLMSLQNPKHEDVMVYGIQENSAYLPNLSGDEAVISDGYLDKYGLQVGDTITLHQKFHASETYDFKIVGSYHYPASMCVFMSQARFREIFDLEPDFFNGYFTNEKLTDLDAEQVATVITQADQTVMADQLEDSMGRMFPLFSGFSMAIYLLMMYLLTKMIIDRNAETISMLKILGYTNEEAARIFTRATLAVVVIALLVSLPISYYLIKLIYYAMMQEYPGWLTFWLAPWIMPAMFAMGLGCYLIVSALQLKNVRRIPMASALRGQE